MFEKIKKVLRVVATVIGVLLVAIGIDAWWGAIKFIGPTLNSSGGPDGAERFARALLLAALSVYSLAISVGVLLIIRGLLRGLARSIGTWVSSVLSIGFAFLFFVALSM